MKQIGTLVVDNDVISIMQDQYTSGGIALQLYDSEGPYARFTDSIPDAELGDGEFLARTRAENTTLRQPMLDTGLFVDTGRRIKSGFIETEVWKLAA